MTTQEPVIKKINFPSAIAAGLSAANIVLTLPFLFIIAEYFDIFATGSLSHLQFHSVLFDVTAIVLAIFVSVYSIGLLVRYFGHQNVKPLVPILFFCFYSLLFVVSLRGQY